MDDTLIHYLECSGGFMGWGGRAHILTCCMLEYVQASLCVGYCALLTLSAKEHGACTVFSIYSVLLTISKPECHFRTFQ